MHGTDGRTEGKQHLMRPEKEGHIIYRGLTNTEEKSKTSTCNYSSRVIQLDLLMVVV